MGTVNVNGKVYDIEQGSKVTINAKNNTLVINGDMVGRNFANKKVHVIIEGCVVEQINSDGDVTCEDVSGFVSAGIDVKAKNVGSTVSAGRDVKCSQVNGAITAGRDVRRI